MNRGAPTSFKIIPGTDITEIRVAHPDWTEKQCRAEQTRVAIEAFLGETKRMPDPVEGRTRGWRYQLNIFHPDERLAVAIDLSDEQAAAIHALIKPNPDDPEWIGEYAVLDDVFIGAVRDA